MLVRGRAPTVLKSPPRKRLPPPSSTSECTVKSGAGFQVASPLPDMIESLARNLRATPPMDVNAPPAKRFVPPSSASAFTVSFASGFHEGSLAPLPDAESFAMRLRARPPIAVNSPPAKRLPVASGTIASTGPLALGLHAASTAPAGEIFAVLPRARPALFVKYPPASTLPPASVATVHTL